ncbi:pyridoxal-dependent decarboxylase conserved domain-containing protein [Ditylenchus destructor]|uniref:Aromatic-L-amino-acid decarboxylase n=1 Tax=Ditylenchus destructor TaxID=166010 RepID=A0AAD4N7E5_9BILA|nr:pyridoxal-dependent decarboxylase conserved domain-containing protein [Ditylenchus destructor]
MDSEAFRIYGKQMVDFVADYWESLDNQEINLEHNNRKSLPNVKPGFIWDMVPSEPPQNGEPWSVIFKDLEPIVLANNTNWHHPNFFAYYPTACSYPAIMGDILSGGIASIGFTWKSSPAMTELEMAMTDWLAKAIGLPDIFLNSHPGPGCGIIQSTASDATLVALLSARARAVAITKAKEKFASDKNWIQCSIDKTLNKLTLGKELVQRRFSLINQTSNHQNGIISMENKTGAFEKSDVTLFENHDPDYFNKFVAYCSDQAHSSVDKGVMLSGVRIRKLKSTREVSAGNFTVQPAVLEAAIKEDRANDLIPFIFIATVGTTNTCGMDSVKNLGPICAREKIWIHVDAAYAGSFLLCEEFRYLAENLDLIDSFNFNPHKAMMINFDCSPMWFKDAAEAINYFNVDPVYLKHEHQAVASDYRHLQVALGRRFRSLKIWFVFRSMGVKKIQEFLREQVKLAVYFAELIQQDERFELFVPQHLGLVCFRIKGDNAINEHLCTAINEDGRIHIVAAQSHEVYFLRFAVCSQKTTMKNVENAYQTIIEVANSLLNSHVN